MEEQVLNFVSRISARAVEEQDEIIMRTIQRIGNDIYTDITVDRNKILEALQDYQEKRSGRKQREWISVDERLPEESGRYLVCTDLGRRTVLDYSAKNKLFNCFDGYSREYAKCVSIDVAYWMPLPEAPKGGDK